MKNNTDAMYRLIGVTLFFVGLIGAIATASAASSNALSIFQVLALVVAENLCMGIGGVLCD